MDQVRSRRDASGIGAGKIFRPRSKTNEFWLDAVCKKAGNSGRHPADGPRSPLVGVILNAVNDLT